MSQWPIRRCGLVVSHSARQCYFAEILHGISSNFSEKGKFSVCRAPQWVGHSAKMKGSFACLMAPWIVCETLCITNTKDAWISNPINYW